MNGLSVADGTLPANRERVEAARDGSSEAWRELFDEHHPRLYRFFRSRVESAETAEDLASETFLDALKGIGGFRWRNRPFGAWLFAIARNRLRMHYRSRRESGDLGAVEPGSIRNEYLTVEVDDVLSRLLSDYRQALEYRYLLGLSGQESAAAMGRSHGSFRALLLRAAKAFRAEYGLRE